MSKKMFRAQENPFEYTLLELFTSDDLGYDYLYGEEIERSFKEVLLLDRLRYFLEKQYSSEKITLSEIERSIAYLKDLDGTDFTINREAYKRICKGFSIQRDDKQSSLFIRPIDFDNPDNNDFLIVNQFTVQGLEKARRPDIVIFINGIPVVVFELKSPVDINATIETAYQQLTNTYRYDIPKLFYYNAFLVISDGNNNRAGTLFTEYAQFKSWNKINSEDGKSDGIGSINLSFATSRAH